MAVALSGCFAAKETALVRLQDMESLKVYESQDKPGHNQFPSAFLDKDGGLCVVFQQMTGDLNRTPDYGFVQHPEQYCIRLVGMRMAPGEKTFRRIWTQPAGRAYTHCIFAPHAAGNGSNLALRGADGSRIEVMETSDCGQTFQVKAVLSIPDRPLYPNELRKIGETWYLAAYDGLGGAYLFTSGDDGATWSKPFQFVTAHDNMTFHEPTVESTSDGNLIVLLRTHRMDIPKHNGIHYHRVVISRGKDGSFQASEAQDTGLGFRGRPSLLRTRDGVLTLVCPGNFLAVSLNDGRTWESRIGEFPVQEVTIFDKGISKPFSHNAETVLLEMPDGRIYCSFFVGSDFPYPPPCDEYIGGIFFRLRRNL